MKQCISIDNLNLPEIYSANLDGQMDGFAGNEKNDDDDDDDDEYEIIKRSYETDSLSWV